MVRISDMKLPQEVASRVSDAKEGLVDALLNLTWQRVSGAGDEGEVVYGTKPSLRFVSGFLLPRYEETGQQDETSDIHLSTHGLDLQITDDAEGQLTVEARFAIYIRALPDWKELVRPELDLFPNPPLRRDLEQHIRDEMKARLAEAKVSEAAKPEEERRSHRELQQEIYRALLGENGVEVSPDGMVADAEENVADDTDADQETENGEDNDTDEEIGGRLHTPRGHYIFHNDNAAQDVDIPQKWRRLPVNLEPLSIELSEDNQSRQAAIAAWVSAMRAAVKATVRNWVESADGRDWAYRPATIRPSHFRTEETWNAFLTELRKSAPVIDDIAPNLDGLSLTIQDESDLRDPRRRNLRIMLENNGRDAPRRRRERFEQAIHQVRIVVDLPAAVHRPLRLDRVEASYRFRDFLSYPAIGINCGVSEKQIDGQLHLATNWMPRYHQPRIVPNAIEGVPTEFAVLGGEDFDPALLRPLIEAYDDWISAEESTLDPAHGVKDQDEAQRERKKFEGDIASYRREVRRIALGIDLLETAYGKFKEDASASEAMPYRAWQLLNQAFQDAGAARGITGWRLFQLTFILAHIPTIASRMPAYAKEPWFDSDFDEETATLLYFPTGGGKSEAFFGLLVFNLFLDRLRGKRIGVTALIRYPLRLLTLQQAQRLLAILMRAELLRRRAGLEGAPFEIGFWVGRGNTPNRTDDDRLDPVPRMGSPKHENDETTSASYREVNESFNKIPVCPICGEHTGLRRISCPVDEEIAIVCFNKTCSWNTATENSPLPFLIVDRDIYRHAPAVLLGVIDKLALIGQHPATINRVMGMFGLARWQERETGRLVMPTRRMLRDGPAANGCEPLAPAYEQGRDVFLDSFPSLIIQDEAHLLEESLGTFAGLFETMLEQLFARTSDILGDRAARGPSAGSPVRLPKIVAATATVSVPEQQFGALYQRRHMHFPYPGTSIYRSFYAVPATPARTERRGLGGGGPRAPEVEAPWMRVYASIMTNGRNHTVTTVSVLAAYHLAVTELWLDLLDETRRDDAADRILGALTSDTPLAIFHSDAIEACAGQDPNILPTLLDLMRISLTYVTNKKGGDQVIDAFREEVAKLHRRHGRDMVQVYTRLISGGVDVAEIQEIMREAEGENGPGDPFPDLSQSLRNIVATSAISHGVDVDKFNAMFFAGMPNDIAEFIQASSRVGRTHVGFSLLIPTPHARRDRYIVETHDVFHRFLERMIAPPAITRWAESAQERVLTSLFQSWLCGWVEQKLFSEKPESEKVRAPAFETVSDVNRLLTGPDMPDAADDFMDFAVRALGVRGRGADHIGGAFHPDYYEDRIRNLAKQLIDEFRTEYATTRLGDYWDNAPVGQRPMMSLRDVDEAGRFLAARHFRERKLRGEEEKAVLAEALRIVRRQAGRVSELDSDSGEL